jgi:hypothetical protein
MARLPSWMECKGIDRNSPVPTMIVQIKYWHPALWLEIVRRYGVKALCFFLYAIFKRKAGN